jgi:hypothetical protein
MARTFPGFSSKMPAFFRGLKKNNAREWFTPRKELFETAVRAPMIELVGQINEDLKKFALDNSVADPKRAIYRLYRDTRFSKDKTPYKTHIGATFPRRGLPKHGGAGYYFGVSHESVEVAGGMYMPGTEELIAVRRAIAADSKRFLKLKGWPAAWGEAQAVAQGIRASAGRGRRGFETQAVVFLCHAGSEAGAVVPVAPRSGGAICGHGGCFGMVQRRAPDRRARNRGG